MNHRFSKHENSTSFSLCLLTGAVKF